MKRIITIAAVGLCLAGCDNARRGVEAAVRANLKDPDSAKFGEFYYNSSTKRACIEVNARNEMGGYAGEHPFELQKTDGNWEVVTEQPDGNMDFCQQLFADVGKPESSKPMTADELEREADKMEAEANKASREWTAEDLDNAADAAHEAADRAGQQNQ